MSLRSFLFGAPPDPPPPTPATLGVGEMIVPKEEMRRLSQIEKDLLEQNEYLSRLAGFLIPLHNKGEVFIPLSLRSRLHDAVRRR